MSTITRIAVFGFGEMLNKAFPFLLVPILTRYFGKEMYGIYQLHISGIIIVSILINSGIELAISRYFYFKGKRFISNILFNYYAFTLTIIILTGMITQNIMTIVVLITAQSQGILNSIYSYFTISKNAKNYVFVQFTQGFLYFILMYIFAKTGALNVLTGLILLVTANLFALLIGWNLATRELNQRISVNKVRMTRSIKYVLQFGRTVTFHQLAQASKGQADKFLLVAIVSAQQLSLYTAAYQLSLWIQVVLMSMNKATLPYFYSYVKNKKKPEYILLITLISFLLVPIVYLIVSSIPNEIYGYILGKDFSQLKIYLVPIACGLAVNLPYMILGNYLFANNKNAVMTLLSIGNSIIYLILLATLQSFKNLGFQYALIISNITLVLMMVLFILKMKKERNEKSI